MRQCVQGFCFSVPTYRCHHRGGQCPPQDTALVLGLSLNYSSVVASSGAWMLMVNNRHKRRDGNTGGVSGNHGPNTCSLGSTRVSAHLGISIPLQSPYLAPPPLQTPACSLTTVLGMYGKHPGVSVMSALTGFVRHGSLTWTTGCITRWRNHWSTPRKTWCHWSLLSV